MRCYLDSSALAKLVVREPESHDLRHFLTQSRLMVTSVISATEIRRAAQRISNVAVEATPRVMSIVAQMDVTRDLLLAAAKVQPAHLRTLDAIHLATAMDLSSELDSFITYNIKLAEAAVLAGLRVEQPGL